ncbi:hypothetical protein ACTMU2_08615 [Cupriavidus basilensis]
MPAYRALAWAQVLRSRSVHLAGIDGAHGGRFRHGNPAASKGRRVAGQRLERRTGRLAEGVANAELRGKGPPPASGTALATTR